MSGEMEMGAGLRGRAEREREGYLLEAIERMASAVMDGKCISGIWWKDFVGRLVSVRGRCV